MPSFFLSVRICVGVFTIPVIFSVYSNLVFDLGEMVDRSKDKPVLIMFSTVVEVSSTLTFLCVGGLLGNSVVRSRCAFFTGLPKEETHFPVIVIDLMSELELLPLHVIIGNESNDDLMMVNTRRLSVCRSRCRISVK